MENGCMAQNDRPGVCASEPCKGIDGFYRKPAAFKDGPPPPLTPANFGGEATDGIVQEPPSPAPTATAEHVATEAPIPPSPKPVATEPVSTDTPSPETTAPAKPSVTNKPMDEAARKKAYLSCICIRYGHWCSEKLAHYTSGCKPKKYGKLQPSECKKSCCSICKYDGSRLCIKLRHACKNY